MTNSSAPLTVLRLGAEGGSIRLLASGPADRRSYRLVIRDGADAFLNEEDRDGPGAREIPPADGWDAALAMLDRECPYWVKLSPLEVHADFLSKVGAAVEARRDGRTPQRWRALLEPSS